MVFSTCEGIYVYAGNYDKTLKSLLKVYEAVIIHGADVARVEPHSASAWVRSVAAVSAALLR